MNYTKKKIEKKGLIKLKNYGLYLFINKHKFNVVNHNNVILNFYYYNNINIIKKYLKETGFIG